MGFGAEPTMAFSWPRVMESRPTCWGAGALTGALFAKNEESWGSTMLAVGARGARGAGWSGWRW